LNPAAASASVPPYVQPTPSKQRRRIIGLPVPGFIAIVAVVLFLLLGVLGAITSPEKKTSSSRATTTSTVAKTTSTTITSSTTTALADPGTDPDEQVDPSAANAPAPLAISKAAAS